MSGIHEVARRAGVSASTVSNVINGRHDKMRPETKRRVLEVIEQLKYTPNIAARQLKSGQNQSLGLIIPSVANPFWGLVAHHVERAARQRGYNLLICNAERDPNVETHYAEAMLSSGITGIILGSSPLSFDYLRDVTARGLKIAAFDQRVDQAKDVITCGVSVDQELGGMLAAQHLIGLGHKRIAMVSGPIKTKSRIGRRNGVKMAMARAGLQLPDDMVWQGGGVAGFGDLEGAELGRMGIRELLSRDDPPTGIIAINDMYALGAYAGARDLGFHIPGDISIVGFDDIILAEIAQPALTTIRQPVPAMAEMIVRMLIAEIGDSVNADDPSFINVTPQLIVRGSTTAAREFQSA